MVLADTRVPGTHRNQVGHRENPEQDVEYRHPAHLQTSTSPLFVGQCLLDLPTSLDTSGDCSLESSLAEGPLTVRKKHTHTHTPGSPIRADLKRDRRRDGLLLNRPDTVGAIVAVRLVLFCHGSGCCFSRSTFITVFFWSRYCSIMMCCVQPWGLSSYSRTKCCQILWVEVLQNNV